MKIDSVHKQVLKKFNALTGSVIEGAEPIKGKRGSGGASPDEYVNTKHIMSCLIRGFYKPAQKPYLLSCRIVASKDNYGEQVIWTDKEKFLYSTIELLPPSKPNDDRAEGDIKAARFNMQHKIPIGILYNIKKGINAILGLGIITEEKSNGAFIVKPYSLIIEEDIS